MDKHNFTLEDFKKSWEKMIGQNDTAYKGRWDTYQSLKVKDYSKQEIDAIIRSGSVQEKINLSRNYFNKDGFYRRIILHYATLLKFNGLLIPNPTYGRELSNSSIQKRYHNAVNFIDVMDLDNNCTNWSIRVLRDGSYYGVVSQLDKQHFTLLDLPVQFCRTRYKDIEGNNLIEFDVSYFDTLYDEYGKQAALDAYPVDIVEYYKKWSQNRTMYRWYLVPADIGVCFQLFDGLPMFLNVIPATIDYDEAVATEKERDREEIRKLIIQKIPHLQDGGLLFEPEEAAEMHKGAVEMMKGNKNINVLTTYADVDSVVSKTASDNSTTYLDNMMQNIYNEAGASGQLFASTGNLALSSSLQNDLALVMVLVYQYDKFITNTINSLYANGNVSFKYTILPVSWYNEKEYIDSTFKLANAGYSFLVPAVAMGFSQKDLSNLKSLENDILNLGELLIPLKSSYTQSSDTLNAESGRPKTEDDEKSDKTIANEESLNQGGSN